MRQSVLVFVTQHFLQTKTAWQTKVFCLLPLPVPYVFRTMLVTAVSKKMKFVFFVSLRSPSCKAWRVSTQVARRHKRILPRNQTAADRTTDQLTWSLRSIRPSYGTGQRKACCFCNVAKQGRRKTDACRELSGVFWRLLEALCHIKTTATNINESLAVTKISPISFWSKPNISRDITTLEQCLRVIKTLLLYLTSFYLPIPHVLVAFFKLVFLSSSFCQRYYRLSHGEKSTVAWCLVTVFLKCDGFFSVHTATLKKVKVYLSVNCRAKRVCLN